MSISEKRKIVFEGQSVTKFLNDNLTCMHIAPDIIIDAGFMPKVKNDQVIEHIFITHTHLDHICAMAWYVDTYFSLLKNSIKIYASAKSIENLKNHFFNNKIWPDFSQIALASGQMAIEYVCIAPGDKIALNDLCIEPVKSEHTEGSFGYIIGCEGEEIYFTSDTYYSPQIAELINARTQIKHLITDVSFDSSSSELAAASKHLTPQLLRQIKDECRKDLIIHVFHMKFLYQDKILDEINELDILGEYGTIIKNGSFIQFNSPINYGKIGLAKIQTYNLDQDQKLECILQCFSKISQSTDSKESLQILGEMVRTAIAADRCSVWFCDEEAKEYYTIVADGTAQIRVPFGKGIVGAVIDSKKPVLENNPLSNPHFDPTNDKRTGYRTKSILAMPIVDSSKNVIGVFQALNKLTSIDNAFSKDDLDYVQIAADYSGRIFEGIKFQEDILQAQKDLIYSIAEMVESRSQETGNHVKRVGKISEAIARGMGLSEEEVKLIGYGAPTHDIGKVGIPDAILNKPAKLTDEEFRHMQKHSQIGFNMLRRFKGQIMEAAAVIAHEHHEKYGGGGYPRGIKGEQIHLYARIVSLADVFDALASDRCYKKAWPLEKIEQYFKDNSGSSFDPKVVEAFFACKEEIYRINRELADQF